MMRFGTLLLCMLLAAASAHAQPKEPPAFMKALFPPDVIMRHGHDIDLSRAQRDIITKAVADTQARTLELQWDMQDSARALTDLMSAPRIDETAALEAAERLMDLEGQVKRAHLGLLIRIKNQLEPEQQQKLTRLREAPP